MDVIVKGDPEAIGDLPVGGKARGLLALHAIHAPVPPWHVCPAHRAPLLRDLEAETLHALFHRLDRGHGIAVRSSSLLEDRQTSARAGAFATRFCAHPDEVPHAIAAVLSSGIGDDPDGMAVLFQTRISPRRAGVLFSAHPGRARPDEAYVEYLAGSPEGVVDGSQSPGTAWLDPKSGQQLRGNAGENLSPALSTELAHWLLRVEDALDWAADIEWAEDGAGLWLLQARPITRLFLHPDLRPSEAATCWFFDQRFAEPLRPITRDTLLPRILEASIGEALDLRGARRPDRLAFLYGGLPYVPLAAYGALCRGLPFRWLPPDIRQLFPQAPTRPAWLPWPSTLINLAAMAWHERRYVFRNRHTWDTFRAELDRALPAIPDADGSDAKAWWRSWDALDGYTMAFLRVHRWSLALADGLYGTLARLGPWGRALLHRAGRSVHLVTREANRARDLAGATPSALEALIRDYGHRSPSLDYAHPTWAELYDGQDYPPLPTMCALRHVSPARGLLPRLLELREEQRFVWEMILARQRRLLLQAGERLAARGLLPDRDAVWWLSREELGAALEFGTRPDPEAWRARRRTHRIFLPAFRPAHIGPQHDDACASKGKHSMAGIGASGGQARGTALVVAHLHTLPDSIPPNTVLVLPCLDPGATAVLDKVAGLIIERGGLLSHAAISAREYGVPLVIGIPGIMGHLKTGDLVCVDGDTGRVEGPGGDYFT